MKYHIRLQACNALILNRLQLGLTEYLVVNSLEEPASGWVYDVHVAE
jgi:hypothetical protein